MNLHTPNLYYPSPMDGNIYPVYIHDENGVLQSVLIEKSPYDELIYPYYLRNTSPFQPPLKLQAEININNGIANLCYYQPQTNGKMNFFYCTASFKDITFLINTHFSQYIPVAINQPFQNHHLSPISEQIIENKFIQQNYNLVPTSITAYPQEIDHILSTITSGTLKNSKVEYDEYGFNISACDHQGNTYYFEKKQPNEMNPVSSFTNYSNSKKDRLKRVKELRLQHRTQQEISEILNVSQKTISNDLKELNMS